MAVGRQLPPNSTNSVHSYLQILLRTFAERCLNSRQSIKCDVLLHQQSWRSSNPNPAVEPKPTSLPMANLALERNSAFMDSHQPVRSHAPKPSISIKEILPRAGMSVRRRSNDGAEKALVQGSLNCRAEYCIDWSTLRLSKIHVCRFRPSASHQRLPEFVPNPVFPTKVMASAIRCRHAKDSRGYHRQQWLPAPALENRADRRPP